MAPQQAEARRTRNGVRDDELKRQLTARRDKLRDAIPSQPHPASLHDLLREVDAALERMEDGSYGLCETCHDPIEHDRLIVDPLLRNCIDHLSHAEKESLQRDLDLANQVQSGLLPKPGRIAPGWTMAFHYRPHGAVSGDFCDVIRLPDGGALFVVGDVMGKGVAASMLTAHLHAIFRSLCTPDQPVNDLVAKANRIFCEGTMSSFFATLVAGRLGVDGAVEICNAGHCHPLHFRNGDVHRIESGGLPMGLFADAEYELHRGRLASGEGLVIHTDGLSETFDAGGAPYGSERPINLLRQRRTHSCDELLADLLADLDQFRRAEAVRDDLTVMVLCRNGST